MYMEFVFIFIFSLVFIRIVRQYAKNLGLIDIPNSRSSHVCTMPRSAGIGFYAAVTGVLALLHFPYIVDHYGIFLSIFLVFIIGVFDDFKGVSPRYKFLVLIISTTLVYYNGIGIHDFGRFFGLHISLGWFALPFSIFAVVGLSNALNLIDGLDGLAASVSIIIFASFWYVGWSHGDHLLMMVSLAFISGLLAFLLFNWYPASIFMGDSGSLLLGFVISILAIQSLKYLPTMSVLFLVAIPVLDTMVVMIRRIRRGASVFAADRCHIHHILRHFFSENTQRTVLFMTVAQMVYSLIGLYLERTLDGGALLILFLLNGLLVYLAISAMVLRQEREC